MTTEFDPDGTGAALNIVGDLPKWVKLLGLAKPIEAKMDGVARRIEARADEVVDKIEARARLQRVGSDGDAIVLMADKMNEVAIGLGTTLDDPLVRRTFERWFAVEIGHQENLEAIGERASAILGNQPQMHEPDDDFVLRFHDDAQKVTNEQMRDLYARVLAGELARPGSIAVSTLEVLKRLDAETARLFQVWRSMSMRIESGTMFLLTLGLKPSDWEPFGLRYFDLLKLEELGLTLEFSAVMNNTLQIDMLFKEAHARGTSLLQLEYLNDVYYIAQSNGRSQGDKKLPLVLATNAGAELAQVVPPLENVLYTNELQRYLEAQGFGRQLHR